MIFFRKSVGEIKLLLKSVYYKGYFTWIPIHIYDHISFSSSQNENTSDSSCKEDKNTHFKFNILF